MLNLQIYSMIFSLIVTIISRTCLIVSDTVLLIVTWTRLYRRRVGDISRHITFQSILIYDGKYTSRYVTFESYSALKFSLVGTLYFMWAILTELECYYIHIAKSLTSVLLIMNILHLSLSLASVSCYSALCFRIWRLLYIDLIRSGI